MSAATHLPRRRFSLRLLSGSPPLVIASVAVIVLMMVVAILADLIAPFHYTDQDLLNRLKAPVWLGGDWRYPLGTDELGRDLFSRLCYAIRVSVLVAILGTVIGAVIGTFLGFVAAHAKGVVDDVIMGLVDAQAALPFLIIALTVLAFFGNSLWLFILIMGVNGWETYTRLTRGMVLGAQNLGYVVAVRTLGATPWTIYRHHVLPNIVSVLIVQFTLNFPQTILLETSLSFLGLGIQPPLTSLGQMLGAGRDHLVLAWWIAVLPGTVIFLTTLAISIIGDWLRDRFDPTID